MWAALRGHYVQFVIFMGLVERYPDWFNEEIAQRAFIDESRFCFWTSPPERLTDYYERELIETASVVLRKDNGDHHLTDVTIFEDMYHVFSYDHSINGGVAAFNEDVIEYVECVGGMVLDNYPDWFYEYFTESQNNPKEGETYLFSVDNLGYMTVKDRCVVLRNRFGEIRQTTYNDFIRHYDPNLTDLTLLI